MPGARDALLDAVSTRWTTVGCGARDTTCGAAEEAWPGALPISSLV
ncbi:MAG: hypothetical protein IPF99_02825 [Deltaproteobacteria bacterium]|nr:hypothetical protein [Deltaproteobacteria bacterium]